MHTVEEGQTKMADSYQHRVVAWWSSGRSGLAKADSALNSIHFTAPPQFGGLEGMWTPEDLLLSAVASCFVTTFRVLAEYSKWEYADLQVEASGIVSKADSGYSFRQITLRPHLKVVAASEIAKGEQLLRKTENLCLVSRVISMTPVFEPVVELASANSRTAPLEPQK
jgi:peroxiredoxin-like protein